VQLISDDGRVGLMGNGIWDDLTWGTGIIICILHGLRESDYLHDILTRTAVFGLFHFFLMNVFLPQLYFK